MRRGRCNCRSAPQPTSPCIADLAAGREAALSLPTAEVRCVELRGTYQVHLDDELVSDPLGGGLTIGIEPAALTYLDTQA